ncbi:hypothetical protein QFZ76_001644 [Streptomyces sp. V4I2]|nr:hypothetical protein [Streptomyces sp. V4I2]
MVHAVGDERRVCLVRPPPAADRGEDAPALVTWRYP